VGKPQFCKNSLRTSQSPISQACQSLCFRLTGRVQSAKLARVCVSGRQFVLHSFWTFQVSDRQAGILAKRISSSIEHSWFFTPTEYSDMDHATDQTGGIISSRENRLLWMQHVIQSTETNSWQTFFFCILQVQSQSGSSNLIVIKHKKQVESETLTTIGQKRNVLF